MDCQHGKFLNKLYMYSLNQHVSKGPKTMTKICRIDCFRGQDAQIQEGTEVAAPGTARLCTSFPSKAETHASEASQMAVRSWPPSRARTTRPPARPISCFVRYPKPVTREKRKCRRRAKVAAGIRLLAKDQRIIERNYIILKNHKGSERTQRII